MKHFALVATLAPSIGLAALYPLPVAAADSGPALTPLPTTAPANPAMVELGRQLFFDTRLSGDWAVSCASCHAPDKGWADGLPLSAGYPSTLNFRNTPSLINVKYRQRFMWDGRLDGADAGTAVRDQITEAHFMNADGRLVQERLKQMPGYVALWQNAFGAGKDPYGPAMFNAIGEFIKTIESRNVPFDRFLKGETTAIGAEARAGYALFTGKAGCVACHNGPLGSDGRLHRLGVPENPDILASPERTITLLRHYASSGMPNYMAARTDLGEYAISKDIADVGKFLTPSLRELKYTAPYMHNGMLATLDEVIAFYDRGGGGHGVLRPLQLDDAEKAALKAFLLSLSGDPLPMSAATAPELDSRVFGEN